MKNVTCTATTALNTISRFHFQFSSQIPTNPKAAKLGIRSFHNGKTVRHISGLVFSRPYDLNIEASITCHRTPLKKRLCEPVLHYSYSTSKHKPLTDELQATYDKYLLKASIESDLEGMKILLKKGANVNAKEASMGGTALHMAAFHGRIESIHLLLAHNAFVNAKDAVSDNTALHIAALNNYSEITQALIDAKVNINERNNAGFTALHMAVINDCYESVNVLLNNKANIDAKEALNYTPLHLAILRDHFIITRLLLNYGARTSVTENNLLDTPLHMAALTGNSEIINLLLDHGAVINQKNINGHTPLDIALTQRNIKAFFALTKASLLKK